MNHQSKMLDEMLSHGLNPRKIIDDGKYHRFDADKSGDGNGFYNLDANGCGVYGNWKTGDKFIFRGEKSKDIMTEEERKKRRDYIKKIESDRIAAEAKAAKDAERIFNNAFYDKPHWYLEKKKILTHQARVDKSGDLIIPIYDEKKIVNVQRISKKGKYYLPGGKKKGCYSAVYGVGLGQKGTAFIAEGFATAASITESTRITCVAALDAGNIIHVAQYLRKKMGKDFKIIIAADNDQFTKVKNTPYNTGLIAARDAAKAVGAWVVFPPFAPDDPEKRTDFNDWVVSYGKESAREILMDIKCSP